MLISDFLGIILVMRISISVVNFHYPDHIVIRNLCEFFHLQYEFGKVASLWHQCIVQMISVACKEVKIERPALTGDGNSSTELSLGSMKNLRHAVQYYNRGTKSLYPIRE